MNIKTILTLGIGILIGAAAVAGPQTGDGMIVRNPPTREAKSGKARVTPLIDSKVGAKSAFLAILEIDPGAKVPVHRDATEEYIHFLEGGGTITLDGRSYGVKAGDTVYMPANAEVSYNNSPDQKSKVIQVFAPMGPEKKYDSWPWMQK